MAIERTYTVPLRSAFLRAPNYCRTPRAVRALRAFLARHMKTSLENVRIGLHLNNHLWSRGIRNPPHKVKLIATKDDAGIVKAELFGKTFEEAPAQEPLPGKTKEGHEHEGHEHEHATPADGDKIKEELERLDKETKEIEKKKAPVKKEQSAPVEKKEAPIVEKKAVPPVEKKEGPIAKKEAALASGKEESRENKDGPKQQTLAETKQKPAAKKE